MFACSVELFFKRSLAAFCDKRLCLLLIGSIAKQEDQFTTFARTDFNIERKRCTWIASCFNRSRKRFASKHNFRLVNRSCRTDELATISCDRLRLFGCRKERHLTGLVRMIRITSKERTELFIL
ncbi:hypothetical protein D9M72_549720 [compost metagenome]